MSAPTQAQLSPIRCGYGALVGFLAATALSTVPISGPPANPSHLIEWWGQVGTGAATLGVVRDIGLVLAFWTALSMMLGALAGLTRSAFLFNQWQRSMPTTWRHALVSTLVATMLSPGPAAAAEGPEPTPPLLTDLGPVEADNHGPPSPGPLLTELGARRASIEPGDDAPTSAVVGAGAAATGEDWLVEPGDHLWHIAEETLSDRGESTDETAVLSYWSRLIEENRSVVGENVDLIHPGTTISLPT